MATNLGMGTLSVATTSASGNISGAWQTQPCYLNNIGRASMLKHPTHPKSRILLNLRTDPQGYKTQLSTVEALNASFSRSSLGFGKVNI